MLYNNFNIKFSIEHVDFYALNISFARIIHPLPSHSHSKDSYEIHYIPFGYGSLIANNRIYEIKPNTLYITGPYVEHEQTPNKEDPMVEYCVYLRLKRSPSAKIKRKDSHSIMAIFEDNEFWFGEDQQNIHVLMQQIFLELETEYTGYIINVQTLLQQLVIMIVRNYENNKASTNHFECSNPGDNTYFIIESSFLYEYQSITLDKLAKRLGLSNRQTERLLQKYYGNTFLKKKTEAKMSVAIVLLRDQNKNITSISNDLGYSSVEHFSNAFKRYYHMSASEYRRIRD